MVRVVPAYPVGTPRAAMAGLVFGILVATCAGCGGHKMLPQSEPLELVEPLAAAMDANLAVALDWVIVRGAPGSWASNADWDEYLIRVQNLSARTVRVTGVTITDALGQPVTGAITREQLVELSKQTVERFDQQGLTVRAGYGANVFVGTGVAVFAASGTVGMAALAGSATAAAATGAAVAGMFVVGPALVLGGAMRGLNNREVAREIEARQTLLPAVLPAGDGGNLDLFFPLAPSPVAVTFTYVMDGAAFELRVDTTKALNGLHVVARDNNER